MKRFHWPLQKLRDVTIHRETALRSELLNLLQQITALRQQLIRRKAELRSLLSELAEQGMERRMEMQDVLSRCWPWAQQRIAALEEQIERLSAQREEKTARLIKLRKSKDTLDRMRQEARQAHEREQLKLEQKEFDQGAQIAFAVEAQAAGHRRIRESEA